MKYPICPISNCYGKSTNKENKSKGKICVHCQHEMNKSDNQKVICKSCGEVYVIREKIKEEEESVIIAGYCYWCSKRKEEEDLLIKQGLITEEERTTENSVIRQVNKIINKKE